MIHWVRSEIYSPRISHALLEKPIGGLSYAIREGGEIVIAESFIAKARELNQQASWFQKIATGQENMSKDNLWRQQPLCGRLKVFIKVSNAQAAVLGGGDAAYSRFL